MSIIWTFSPSSEKQLQLCIEAASSQNEDNKWFQLFGINRQKVEGMVVNKVPETINNNEEVIVLESETTEDPKPEVFVSKLDDEFLESIEIEPVSKFGSLVEKCLDNESVASEIAEKLSNSAVEKVCNHLFNKTDINMSFLDIFYQKFFPAYLKREFSWLSLDLLVKSNKAHPVQFRKLLKLMLKDLEIPNKVLQDLIQMLNEEEKYSFMNVLIEVDLNGEEFLHNLFTIYTLYKEFNKTDSIQLYLLNNIIEHSQMCVNERSYGRLLLTFLQTQRERGPIHNIDKLENIIEMHRTPFKKPCATIFKEIFEKFNTSDL